MRVSSKHREHVHNNDNDIHSHYNNSSAWQRNGMSQPGIQQMQADASGAVQLPTLSLVNELHPNSRITGSGLGTMNPAHRQLSVVRSPSVALSGHQMAASSRTAAVAPERRTMSRSKPNGTLPSALRSSCKGETTLSK